MLLQRLLPAAAKGGPDAWRSLCTDLAERAAHLEVVLALVSEIMAVYLVGVTSSCGAQLVADAAACPPTRVGWVDEAAAAILEPAVQACSPSSQGASAARAAPEAGAAPAAFLPPPPKPSVRSAAVQARLQPAQSARGSQTEERATVEAGCQTDAEAAAVLAASVEQGCQTDTQVPARTQDAAVGTPEQELDPQIFLAEAAVQARVDVDSAEVQASVSCVSAEVQADTRCSTTDAEAQTLPPPAPKVGGLRDKQLTAEQANRQLEALKEKLSLEREAASALEEKLRKASRSIAQLQGERSNLAAAAQQALEAARRPPTASVGAQATAFTFESDAQTDRIPFWSHSWHTRDDAIFSSEARAQATSPSRSASLALAGDDIASQEDAQPPEPGAAAKELTVAATQTPSAAVKDACVGDEIPLKLALGTSSLPDAAAEQPLWKVQYEEGMAHLAQQWRSRWEEADEECRRLTAKLSSLGVQSGTSSTAHG